MEGSTGTPGGEPGSTVEAGAAGTPVFGRTAELAAIERLLDADRLGARALVLEGEAGIGKTTLVRAALGSADRRGARIMRAAPGEREHLIAFAGLADLLARLDEDLLAALPVPQSVALATATRRLDGETVADELAVSLGFTAILRDIAASGLVLLVVDDLQWLDPQTLRVLEFAARRIADQRVAFLCSTRTSRPGSIPLGLDRSLWPDAVEVARLGPLDAVALDRLLRARLGIRLPRPTLLRLLRTTRGNPFYALEVAASVVDGGELRIPPTLADALAGRLERLPSRGRRALLLAAASLQPVIEVVEAATADEAGLGLTIAEGLLEADGPRLRFTHPLLASVAYERALPGERRAAHRRLSEVVTEPVERALHLARGLETPDADAAAILEATAAAAAARGSEVAPELAEAAARLTPPSDTTGRDRRLAAAADHHTAQGHPARGRELLEQVIAGQAPGPERAALLWRLADTIGDSITGPIQLCEQALAEAGDDPGLRSEIHTALGSFTWIAGDLNGSLAHCLEAVRYADRSGDSAQLAIAIGEACHANVILGLPWDRAAMDRALAIEAAGTEIPAALRPSMQLGIIALITDDPGTAEPVFREEVRRTQAIGDEPGAFHALMRLSELGLRTGQWAAALATAREAHALVIQAGIEQEEAAIAVALAAVLAHVGAIPEAEDLAGEAYRTADAGGDRGVALRAAGVLGFIELSRGRPDLAVTWLSPARRELIAMGTGELSISSVVQNEIEALVSTGALDEADAVIEHVERIGTRTGRTWHRVVAARGRALAASSRSDEQGAATAIDEALRLGEELPQPFERARTLLAAGVVERRAQHWAVARTRLVAALEAFDGLGASAWAERAADDLRRLPGRRPGGNQLSDTERQVAALVADGLSNKEVAGRMFLSVRAVEANLTRIYAKLGVHSRVELARRGDQLADPRP